MVFFDWELWGNILVVISSNIYRNYFFRFLYVEVVFKTYTVIRAPARKLESSFFKFIDRGYLGSSLPRG